jgi:hypothetical protein
MARGPEASVSLHAGPWANKQRTQASVIKKSVSGVWTRGWAADRVNKKDCRWPGCCWKQPAVGARDSLRRGTETTRTRSNPAAGHFSRRLRPGRPLRQGSKNLRGHLPPRGGRLIPPGGRLPARANGSEAIGMSPRGRSQAASKGRTTGLRSSPATSAGGRPHCAGAARAAAHRTPTD